ASFVVFAIFYLGPTNPAQPICDQGGRSCTPERLEAIEKRMGLDKPVTSAYAEVMKGVAVGRDVDFGASVYECDAPCLGITYNSKKQVTEELKDRLVPTVFIAIGGSLTYLAIGVVVGVLAAARHGSTADRLLVSSSLVISAIPYYLVCLLA